MGAMNMIFGISACVITSLAVSGLIHGKLLVKDFIYSPIAGGVMVATSSSFTFNLSASILLGIIAGVLQVLFNIVEQKMASKPKLSTNTFFLFGIQGFLGGIAGVIMRAVAGGSYGRFDFANLQHPYRLSSSGEQLGAVFVALGFGIIGGLLTSIFIFLVNK
eukprot:GHVR01147442.1.p1 GENE.GHVR01147442.1~~GHVR01147442.1.p1  ORF type:complete len:162 (-),score=9.82 GHVR01147442.1:205-690(-)